MKVSIFIALTSILGGLFHTETPEEKAVKLEQKIKSIELTYKILKEHVESNNFDKPIFDAWGEVVKIKYVQKWFNQEIIAVSGGPDKNFETDDDVIYTKSLYNPWGFTNTIQFFMLCLFIFCSLISLVVISLKPRGRYRFGKFFTVFICILTGPIALFFLFFSDVLSTDIDLGLVPDIDIDIDID